MLASNDIEPQGIEVNPLCRVESHTSGQQGAVQSVVDHRIPVKVPRKHHFFSGGVIRVHVECDAVNAVKHAVLCDVVIIRRGTLCSNASDDFWGFEIDLDVLVTVLRSWGPDSCVVGAVWISDLDVVESSLTWTKVVAIIFYA